MPRATLAVLATALLIALSGSSSADARMNPLERAQQKLAEGQGRAAAALFEDALPGATVQSRPEILAGLRQAYRLAIEEAEVADDADEASLYREHLAIIERSIVRPRIEARPTDDPTHSHAPAAPARTSEPARELPRAPEAPPSLASEPDAIEPRATSTESEPSRDIPEIATPLAEPSSEEKAPVTNPAGDTAREVAAADAAFLAKRYDTANQLYAALARDDRLPEVRRDPWAYCRMVEVVRRINAEPQSSREWDWVHKEIAEIRALSPRNWYAEYLRNLATELSTRGQRKESKSLVMRGASPDDGQNAPQARQRAESDTPRAANVGQPIRDWQILETTNFRVLHLDESLAQHVARAAEEARSTQQQRWAGTRGGPPWQPRCDIYLYPDAETFSRMTGQPTESPGFSTMALNGGQVTVRRVNLRADHPNIVHAILPHEVTHVVLADLFPMMQIPRWADEGMAVLSEPPGEQDLRAADLTEPLSSGRVFKLSELMTMDYPDERYWALYYAQSVSLTRFLVELESPARFVEFVQASQRNGVEPELRRIYGINGFDELQTRWREQAQGQVTTIASAKRDDDAIQASSNAESTRR